MPRWLFISPVLVLLVAGLLTAQIPTQETSAQGAMAPGRWNRNGTSNGANFTEGQSIIEGGGAGGQGDIDQVTGPTFVRRSGNFGGIGAFNYQFWYTGLAGGAYSLNYAQSGNGVGVSKFFVNNVGNISENPVMDGRGTLDFDRRVLHPVVLDDLNGPCQCFRIYYEGTQGSGANPRIGLATTKTGVDFAPDTGAVDQGAIRPTDPVIDVAGNTYRSQGVGQPTVLKKDGKYMMWFTAYDDEYNSTIGYADSNDGLNWNVRNTPVLFKTNGYGDDREIGDPEVIYDGKYRMYYSGRAQDDRWRIFYAYSNDGITWTKYTRAPMVDISAAAIIDNRGVTEPAVDIEANGDYRMYFVPIQDAGPSGIYLAYNPRPIVNAFGPGATQLLGQGLPQTSVRVVIQETGNVIGQGTVDDSGNFLVNLSQPVPSGFTTKVFVDDRDTSGAVNNGTPVSGATVSPTPTDKCFQIPGSCSIIVTNAFIDRNPTATPVTPPTFQRPGRVNKAVPQPDITYGPGGYNRVKD